MCVCVFSWRCGPDFLFSFSMEGFFVFIKKNIQLLPHEWGKTCNTCGMVINKQLEMAEELIEIAKKSWGWFFTEN